MIPQVARRLIQLFGKNAKLLFDPYCGTGTSLVEANLAGINAIGTDLNPLARLIAETKTTRLNLDKLKEYISDVKSFLFKANFGLSNEDRIEIPKVTNIDYWFSKTVQEKLGIILKYINNISEKEISNFFKVAFSETVRESSYVKSGEFKLVRIKNLSEEIDIDVFQKYISKLERNIKGLEEFIKEADPLAFTKVYDFNTVEGIPNSVIKESSVDLIITSPPYGDSRTTVAYGQFSRLSSEWLGFKEANQIDNILMGGGRKEIRHKFTSQLLNDVIPSILKKDKKRAYDVISFYYDYEKSIQNISKVVKKNGYTCFVVGNRTVKGIKIPNDEITLELFEANGFKHIETIVRNIPNKRMPLRNSPTNIPGQTSSTMKNEYIVIIQKVH